MNSNHLRLSKVSKPKVSLVQTLLSKHIETTLILQQRIPNDVIPYICDFAGGFVTEGKLKINTRRYSISHQIRYLHQLLFMDFWRMEKFIFGNYIYNDIWEYSYLTCIYDPATRKLYTDKHTFFERYHHPKPLYQLHKIAREYYKCTDIKNTDVQQNEKKPIEKNFLNCNMEDLYCHLKKLHISNKTEPKPINLI